MNSEWHKLINKITREEIWSEYYEEIFLPWKIFLMKVCQKDDTWSSIEESQEKVPYTEGNDDTEVEK